MKIKLINTLLTQMTTRLQAHRLNYYLLLKGKEKKIPQDIKFKVDIANQDQDFLGFYGQITINNINSSVFPYFYVVLVAKKDFGLHALYQSYSPHQHYVKEFKSQKDVEVLVVRQNTDVVRNGYWTKTKQVHAIFLEGLALAEQAAVKYGRAGTNY